MLISTTTDPHVCIQSGYYAVTRGKDLPPHTIGAQMTLANTWSRASTHTVLFVGSSRPRRPNWWGQRSGERWSLKVGSTGSDRGSRGAADGLWMLSFLFWVRWQDVFILWRSAEQCNYNLCPCLYVCCTAIKCGGKIMITLKNFIR